MEIKKKIIIIFTLLGEFFMYAQQTHYEINKPDSLNYEVNLVNIRKQSKIYKISDSIITSQLNEEKYYFMRRMEIRKNIIDSLKLKDKNQFIIIDTRSDSNGQRVESSYFFFNKNYIEVYFKKTFFYVNNEMFVKFKPEYCIKSYLTLESDNKSLFLLSIYFKNNRKHKSHTFKGGLQSISYFVTTVTNNKINYFSVSGEQKIKIKKLF